MMGSNGAPSPSSVILDLAGLPEPVVKSIKQLVESVREGLVSQGHSGQTYQSRPPLRGRFADLKLSISTEDLDEAQREAWQNFPREFPEPGRS
jgi:hypothetical protein